MKNWSKGDRVVQPTYGGHARAWRVPHSAFHDATVQAAQPRHSIEFRTIAYFE